MLRNSPVRRLGKDGKLHTIPTMKRMVALAQGRPEGGAAAGAEV
jgi:hypothetical protein